VSPGVASAAGRRPAAEAWETSPHPELGGCAGASLRRALVLEPMALPQVGVEATGVCHVRQDARWARSWLAKTLTMEHDRPHRPLSCRPARSRSMAPLPHAELATRVRSEHGHRGRGRPYHLHIGTRGASATSRRVSSRAVAVSLILPTPVASFLVRSLRAPCAQFGLHGVDKVVELVAREIVGSEAAG
jgi:hypothetical protein